LFVGRLVGSIVGIFNIGAKFAVAVVFNQVLKAVKDHPQR